MAPDVRKPRSLFENVPADGHHGCQLEETRTSVRRRFLGSSSDKVSAYLPQMGVPEIKSNRNHPLLCRRVADLVDHDCVRSAAALRELTVSPAILIWQRLVHLYRV